MNTKNLKTISLNAALLLLFTVAAFAAAEFFVRVLFKDDVVLFPRYHTDAQYGDFTLRTIRPNSTFRHTSVDGSWEYVTNAQGFRNRGDFPYAKPDGVVRILSIGDSQTQGYEARQDFTFSAAMGKYLNARGRNVEVINAGVSGFSTAEELVFLENEGIKYAPDAVVLGFFANDYEDNIKAGLFRLDEDGSLSVAKKEHVPGVRIQNFIYSLPLVAWLSENSYFYSMLFNGVWEYAKDVLASEAAAKVTEYALPTNDAASDYEAALTAALLTRMQEFCTQRGIPLIIIDVPKISRDTVRPSIDPALREQIADRSGHVIDGTSLLADYVGVAEIHRPHGHRHITEFTHLVLGVAAAKEIDAIFSAESSMSSSAPPASPL